MYFILLFAAILGARVLAAAELPVARHAFVVVAHRANHTRAHENTLSALRAAIEAGVDYAEIDVRRTVDGQHILMHDGSVDRMTDGHGRVRDLTLAQLRALQVRDRRRPEIPADRIPTFEEALEVAKDRLNLYLDFKDGDRRAVARTIQERGLARQVLIYDDADAVKLWHEIDPGLPLIVSPPGATNTGDQLVAVARQTAVQVFDGPWKGYTRESIRTAERAGVRVWPDIQNGREDAAYFQEIIDLGFTGVQTDHPEELIAWLRQHGRR